MQVAACDVGSAIPSWPGPKQRGKGPEKSQRHFLELSDSNQKWIDSCNSAVASSAKNRALVMLIRASLYDCARALRPRKLCQNSRRRPFVLRRRQRFLVLQHLPRNSARVATRALDTAPVKDSKNARDERRAPVTRAWSSQHRGYSLKPGGASHPEDGSTRVVTHRLATLDVRGAFVTACWQLGE